jgi:PAS domain S-box-containing protein
MADHPLDPLLAHVADSARDVLTVEGPGGDLRWISPSVGRLLGWRPAELLGTTLASLVHESDRPALDAAARGFRQGTPAMIQFRLRGADGLHRWVDASFSPCLHDEALEVVVGVLRDEEDRHAARAYADDALREKERYLRAVFDDALDPMVIVDHRGLIVDANPAAHRLVTGEAGRGLLGLRLRRFVTPASRQAANDLWRRLPEDGRVTGRIELATAGGPRTVEFAVVADVLPGLHLGVVRDLTELLSMQARLALADRLASVGTVAAGVAHELKNPLAYVGANLEFLQEGLTSLAARRPEESRAVGALLEAAREALTGAQRMQVIVHDLKTFSRDDDDPHATADVHRVLESCINMAWSEIKRRATLRRELRAVPPVRLAEARLGQVILNLLVNAAQALPLGDPRGHEVGIATRPASGGLVEIEVWDTGVGISPAIQSRIFEPFFTTKRPGEGTGLGLSICKSIVDAARGTIEVASEPGKGARFRVLLPSAAEVTVEWAARRRPRVLVLDDEPLVASAIERALLAEWDVQSLTRATTLAERLGRGERYDVVLCDLSLPEEDGVSLHRALARLEPGLAGRTGFLTGGSVPAAARAYCEANAIPCLEKPFEVLKLRALVASLHERRPSSATAGGP